jgi:hypothetical protein
LQTLNHDNKTLILAPRPLVLLDACVTKANLTQKNQNPFICKGEVVH